MLEAARDDLRCMTRENQAVHAELAKTAETAKKATAAQQRLDRDRETLRQQALRAKVERDDALHVYRATCREKDAARKGADAAALAQADLRGKLDAAEHKMRAMEAEMEQARKDASASNTAAGSLEREVAQAAKTSDADQRTIDALRAEIQRLKTAPAAVRRWNTNEKTPAPSLSLTTLTATYLIAMTSSSARAVMVCESRRWWRDGSCGCVGFHALPLSRRRRAAAGSSVIARRACASAW